MSVFFPMIQGGFDSIVIVKEASDLSGELSSTELYWIDGIIDMGSQSIGVPSTGLAIFSPNPNIGYLRSSEDNYTMFIPQSVAAGSGGLQLIGVGVDVTGTGSQVFDLDNANDGGFDEFEVRNTNFNGCTSLGIISGYRQALWSNVGVINCFDGLEIDGTWTGLRLDTCIAINFPASKIMFKAGGALSVDNFFSDFNFRSVAASSVFCDITEGHIRSKGGFILNGFRTTADDAMPNLPASSSYAKYRNCLGIKNTYAGGRWEVTTEVETVIGAVSTPVKMAGVTTYEDMQWFTQTADNEFVYDGDQPLEVIAQGTVSLSDGSNNEVSAFFRQWDDSAGVYIDGKRSVTVTPSGGRANSLPVLCYFVINNNDRVELWLENQTSSSNITATLGSLVSVSER